MPQQRFWRAAVLSTALLAGASAPAAAQANQASMYVSVVDTVGAPVAGLGVSDFLVRDDNVAREVLRVAPATEPMQIEILVDNSEGARDDIADIRRALEPFTAALLQPNEAGRQNEVGLVGIADRPTILASSTIEEEALQKGINRIFAQTQSGTYLLDSILEVCKGFKTRGATRPVIVAITTEWQELSPPNHDAVLAALRDTGAAFHAVVLGRPSTANPTDETRSRNIVLDRGPRSTGGHYQTLLSSQSLDATLLLLADELTHQYLVTFGRPASLIPPEVTTVTAKQSGLTARGTVVKPERKGP
jgi:hypothetical protein